MMRIRSLFKVLFWTSMRHDHIQIEIEIERVWAQGTLGTNYRPLEHLEMILAQKGRTNAFKWRMRRGGDDGRIHDVAGRSTKLVSCNIILPVHNQSRPTWTSKPWQEQAPTLTFSPCNRGYTMLMLYDYDNNILLLTSLSSIVTIMRVQNIECIMDHFYLSIDVSSGAFSHISHRNEHLITLLFTPRVNLEWWIGLTPKRMPLYCGRKLEYSRHGEKMQTPWRKAPGPQEIRSRNLSAVQQQCQPLHRRPSFSSNLVFSLGLTYKNLSK